MERHPQHSPLALDLNPLPDVQELFRRHFSVPNNIDRTFEAANKQPTAAVAGMSDNQGTIQPAVDFD